jgi:hypothetical protein
MSRTFEREWYSNPVSALLSRYRCQWPSPCRRDHLGRNSGIYFDPTTCQPFSGNIIPAGRLNPAAVNYLNAFPLPSRTDRYLDNYLDTQSEANKYNTFDGRIDWNALAQ